ncbi:MAG: hypothetical protein ACRBBW_13040 [Cellvibrionaceae bacterium]
MTDSILSNDKREEWTLSEITPTELRKKESLRQEIASQIKNFLAAGNSIQVVEVGRIARLPPVSKYDLYEHVLG